MWHVVDDCLVVLGRILSMFPWKAAFCGADTEKVLLAFGTVVLRYCKQFKISLVG